MWLRGRVAVLLNLPLDDARILDMPADTVEMTYAMYMQLENERWARLERILGVTWSYEEVMRMQTAKPSETGEDALAPTLLGPGDKAFFPLALSLNPGLLTDVRKKFHTGIGNVFGDEGINSGTQSLFGLPKEQFKRIMGDRSTAETDDEYDVRVDAVKYIPNKRR